MPEKLLSKSGPVNGRRLELILATFIQLAGMEGRFGCLTGHFFVT